LTYRGHRKPLPPFRLPASSAEVYLITEANEYLTCIQMKRGLLRETRRILARFPTEIILGIKTSGLVLFRTLGLLFNFAFDP
jgi:hypothetical protein